MCDRKENIELDTRTKLSSRSYRDASTYKNLDVLPQNFQAHSVLAHEHQYWLMQRLCSHMKPQLTHLLWVNL